MIYALMFVAASVFFLVYVILREGRMIRGGLDELIEAVNQLRLTSRARINSVATADNRAGRPGMIRVSRVAKGKRVVTGGSEGSKQRKDLEQSLESKRE